MAIDFGTLILNETPDAVVLTSTAGEVVCWSNGAQSVFGYTSEQAVGRQLDALIVPAALATDGADVLQQAVSYGIASYESMRQTSDGTLIYIDGSCKVVRNADGEPEYILWSKKDVTALKVLRDAKLVEARYDGILESMPDAIILANAAGRIVLANCHAEELFGYPRHALRGMVLDKLMPQRFRAAHILHRSGFAAQPLARPMGSGRDLFGLRSDGVEFPVEISLSPVTTEEGTLVMSAIRDVSERKRIETALHEKNVELAKAVATKDRFLAGMSHELRTPLNAIIGFTGTMLMKLPGPINDEQSKQLRMVQSSARHLLSLINDLLDLTHIESGRVQLDVEPLRCRALIDEVLTSFKPQARSKGLALEFEPSAEDLLISSDRRAVQQILMNLLHNAIKFTNSGAVLVRMARSLVGERQCATISVSDTGIGIGSEQRGNLFQAFSQLDGNALRQFEGTGLGLHLSRKLASLLHGEILFDSEYGKGSVFTLALPLQE
ncbi:MULTISPECIES: PAS domain-containing sensor histidine kinase [unclassified Duganella]|jgi:PAS domain S-box-containing protein|uniref:PAS domain-containing sensor histidine kinase n=1 Tax=unclassified Duganella TaxID=2636909 RepID=UPI000885F95F|nr:MULTISPECIES: PAS domain S-box protein [unclassified Duganella]SDH54499.1 PAS fold [Duganella sp. OV458]SDK68497.1 PAS/PAC sensor signal transduction histidine kinase [Duganella sp. OV510]